MENALADLKAGTPARDNEGVGFAGFKDITDYARWAAIEERAAEGKS
jgi:hypothetical protein